MLPYVDVPPLRLGPLVVAPYGALVSAGVLAGLGVCLARARPLGLPVRDAFDAFWWAVMGGVAGAHLVEVVAYRPELLANQGWRALTEFGAGLSSFGAFFAGIGVLLLRLRIARKPPAPFLDMVAECLVVGWIVGRLGCVLAHDHPGRLTGFPLAVAYPDGPRHEPALYELAYTLLVLLPALLAVRRAGGRPGAEAAVTALLYAPGRFLLDFLRASDLPGSEPRYAGLTPGQYGALLLLLAGTLLARGLRRDRRPLPPG